MNIQPTTWNEVAGHLSDIGYPHHQRINADLFPLQQKYPQSSPFFVSGPDIPTLVAVKGPLFTPDAYLPGPMVEFVVTFPPTYPEAFPVLTIEQPPPGYCIKSHPHVGADGQCFLTKVSSWNGPGGQDLIACVDELAGALRANYPFASGGAPPPPQQARPQQFVPQQQQQQQQQPQQYYRPPPQQTQNSKPFYMPNGALETLFVGSAVLSAKASCAVTKAVVKGVVGNSSGMSALTGSTGNDRQKEYQRQLQEQKEAADAQFQSVVTGQPLPANTQITFPPHSGLGSVVCGPHPTMPLQLAGRNAPPPLPPVQGPTPDEQHKIALQQEELRKQQEAQREAVKPKPQGAMGIGLKALSSGARAMGNLAKSARNSVEEKVRNNDAEEDQKQFEKHFPAEATKETLAAAYNCKLMLGDGTAHMGILFITNYQLLWSMNIDHYMKEHPGQPAPTEIKMACPLQYVVCIQKGECLNVTWLNVVSQNNCVWPFFGFETGTAGKVGAFVSASLSGTPADRAFNWMDHRWRAVAPVPCPNYAYGPPIIANAQQPQARRTNTFF